MIFRRFPPGAIRDFPEIPNFSLQVIFFVSEANSTSLQYELLRSSWKLRGYHMLWLKGNFKTRDM